MSTQYFKQTPFAYTTKDTAPLSTAGTGTITTDGVGYATTAANQLEVGYFVFSAAGNQVRLVTKVLTSTTGELSEAFSSDLSAAALKYVKKEDVEFVYEISVGATYGADSATDGVALKDGSTRTFRMPENSAYPQNAPLSPIVVDGATGNCTVLISKMISY